MIWHIAEHILLVLSGLANVFFIVELAILYNVPAEIKRWEEELKKPVFPNYHDGKLNMHDAWVKGNEDPVISSMRKKFHGGA